QEASNSYYEADTFSFIPTWEITAKTTIRARYDYSERDYFGAIVATPDMRHDKVHTFLLGAEWRPRRTILIDATLRRDTRDSNFGTLDYDANSAGITAQLLF